ncbi:retrotransposon ORF1 [Tanacetum coccineum]
MASQDARLTKFEADFKQQHSEMTNKIDTVLKAITDRIARALPSDTVKNPKLSTYPVLSTRSYPTKDPQCSTHVHVQKNDDSHKEELEAREQEVEYFDVLPTRSELAYHKYLMCGPIPSIFLRNPIITEGCPSNLKIPCNIGHVHVERAYIDLNSPLNIMTRMMYNWIMRKKLDPRENSNRGISNFIGRIKGMRIFVGNFTYIIDFMIVEDISSIIDPRLSQVVLGRPFIKISNMTYDLPEGVVRFTKKNDEVTYKMPYKIEQYNSLSNLEKEHTKLVYLRNEEDKRIGVEYVMSKILGFYKECLELGPEYLTGMDDEGEVTLYLTRRSLEVLRKFHWMIIRGRFNQLSHVSSPLLSKPVEY